MDSGRKSYIQMLRSTSSKIFGKLTEQLFQTLHIYSVSFGGYIIPPGNTDAGLLLLIIMITLETINFNVTVPYFLLLVYLLTKLD